MIAARQASPVRRWPNAARWGGCFALALAFHAAGAAALLARWGEDSDLVANAPVVMVELAPAPVSPNIAPNELPPGPQQSEAEPEPTPEKPIEKVELPPDPQAEPLTVTPPPKPVEKPKENKPKQKHASLASAPSTAEQQAQRAAAPMPGASSRNSDAVPNWKSQLVARLERYKRYPSEAQSWGERGVAQLAFSVDRSGGVHNARIVQSSGSSILDRETLTLVERAQPLPPPPPEVTGSQIPIVVPIRYNAR
jgi:protein TonB